MERTKTFRRERQYVIYAVILFFILVNLFFMPKRGDNGNEIAMSVEGRNNMENIQPVNTTGNLRSESVINREDIPNVINVNKETNEINQEKEDKTNEEKANDEHTSKEQQVENENNKNESETELTPTAIINEDEKVGEKNVNQINNEEILNKNKESDTQDQMSNNNNINENNNSNTSQNESTQSITPVKTTDNANNEQQSSIPLTDNQSPPETASSRKEMENISTSTRHFFRYYENLCMFGFIGIIIYLIYSNNKETNSTTPPQPSNQNQKAQQTNSQNVEGYALLDNEY